jgi:hypothetical protein
MPTLSAVKKRFGFQPGTHYKTILASPKRLAAGQCAATDPRRDGTPWDTVGSPRCAGPYPSQPK